MISKGYRRYPLVITLNSSQLIHVITVNVRSLSFADEDNWPSDFRYSLFSDINLLRTVRLVELKIPNYQIVYESLHLIKLRRTSEESLSLPDIKHYPAFETLHLKHTRNHCIYLELGLLLTPMFSPKLRTLLTTLDDGCLCAEGIPKLIGKMQYVE